MKSIVTTLLAAVCLLMYSCSKSETDTLPGDETSKHTQSRSREGGDDDDGPIILEITKDQNARPVAGALVSLTKNTEERYGYTDNAGHCQIQLPEQGHWNLTVVYQDNVFVNTRLNILDSFSYRIDTLQTE